MMQWWENAFSISGGPALTRLTSTSGWSTTAAWLREATEDISVSARRTTATPQPGDIAGRASPHSPSLTFSSNITIDYSDMMICRKNIKRYESWNVIILYLRCNGEDEWIIKDNYSTAKQMEDSIKILLVAACFTKQYVIYWENKSEILLPDNKVCSTQSNEFLSCGEVWQLASDGCCKRCRSVG